jgi:hypothetical protein
MYRYRKGRFGKKYTVLRGGLLMGPKDTFQFHGDGVLKMCCFDARFRFYADVTSKIRQIGNAVPFTRKVSEEKISLSKEDIVMKLIRPHIKKK